MSTRPGGPRFAGAEANSRDFHETFFILAFARDLSRAHCAQPQGPRAGRGGGRSARRLPRSQPMMALPALIDGEGPILFESLAIIEYLDETHPTPPLLPRDARGRARVRGARTNRRLQFTPADRAARARISEARIQAR